jgi:esterase/lipase
MGKIETTAIPDIVELAELAELAKKWSRLAALDDYVLKPDPQVALKKEESNKIIQKIAPQIEVTNPTIQIIEAIQDPKVGIPSRDTDKIVQFLTAVFIDNRPTTANAFIMWLEQDKQAVTAKEKRAKEQESIKELLKKYYKHLGRDDS